MNEPTAYEIVVQGRPSERLLRPLLDDFTATGDLDGRTRLTGVVRDASHLHGIVSHLTSVNVEIVRLAPSPTGTADDLRGPGPSSDPEPTPERSTS